MEAKTVFYDGVNGATSGYQCVEPFFLSGSSSFMGSSSIVSFKDVCGGKRSERLFFNTYDHEENGDDDFDEYLHQPEKKRRLTVGQVQLLEKSFETENKLEPERKVLLAKELGLQPRQVAIWFQNRRARWKNKQMEKDFDTLQASYESLKSDYECLLKEKEKLKAEVEHLTNKLQLRDQDQGNDNELANLFNQSNIHQQEPIVESNSESEDQHFSISGYENQDNPSSAKSDVIDSDSSHYADAGQSSSFIKPGGKSSYAFEANHSDISQDDEDYLDGNFFPPSHIFPKIENMGSPVESGHFDLSGDHDHASLFWPYWDTNLKILSCLHM